MRALTSRTALAAGVIVAGLTLGAAPARAQEQRTYAGGRFFIEFPDLKPSSPGFIKSFEGGYAYGDVVTEPRRGDTGGGKRLANVRWAPLQLLLSPATAVAVIEAGLAGKPLDGRFVTADFNYKADGGIDFKQATVTRIAFQPLDGATKDACYVEIELQPSLVTPLIGDGSSVKVNVGPKQRAALCSNFKVQLGDLPMNRVASVDSIVLTRAAAATSIGMSRDAVMRAPSEWNAHNVTLSISEADYAPIAKWYEDFVIKGNNGPANEKTLDITWLEPNLSTQLLTLRGSGVGVVALRRSRFRANDETIRRFELELYVERWEVMPGAAMYGSLP